MSYLPTHSGEIWGSAAQKAAVKKAAEASARKRRKNEQAVDLTPHRSVAEVEANRFDYPSREAHTTALIAAKRRERLAAGHGPADIPKGKALGADGTLHDATNRVPVEPEGKRPTLQSERIQARIDSYKAKLAQPDPSRDGRGHEILAKAMKASYVELRAAKSNEATREMNQRLAAEKAAKTPDQLAKEKAAEALRGQESLLAKYRKVIQDSPGSWAAKDAQDRVDRILAAMGTAPAAPEADTPPRPAAKQRGLVEGKAVKVELQGGAVQSATIDTVYDTFYLVKLKDGTVINVDKEPQSLAHRILPARKPKPTGIK